MRLRPSPELASADRFREEVDALLERFLAQERLALAGSAPEAVVLIEALTQMVEAGGKRLRPVFCYWGYRAAGGSEGPGIVRAGAAVELLHTSALIHDDVMDRSELRRGRPTAFRWLAGMGGRPEEADRLGRSAAILAGNLSQALADRLLAEAEFPAERIIGAFVHFNWMRQRAVSGELLDLLRAQRGDVDEAGARRVADLKSGSYTVVGPLLMGATLSGAGSEIAGVLERYGRPLGEAFQLRDDVLGTFGDPALTGKDRDTDIREGKRTTLVAKAWGMGTAESRRLMTERLGRPGLSSNEVQDVRDLIRSSGALGETVAVIDGLSAQAKAALENAPLPEEVDRALRSLADLVALRDA